MHGLNKPDKWDSMPASVRKRKADGIEKLVNKLLFELGEDFFGENKRNPYYPIIYNNYNEKLKINKMAVEYIQSQINTDRESPISKFVADLYKKDIHMCSVIVADTINFATSQLPRLLESVLANYKHHALNEPLVYRANDASAQKNILARNITSKFVDLFGKPLRKETLAIISIFFELDPSFDEAYLSKIAPVKPASKLKK